MTDDIHIVCPITLSGEAIRTHLIKSFLNYEQAKEYKDKIEQDLKHESFCKVKIFSKQKFSIKKRKIKIQQHV